jgi:acyl-coenzyme A synthetase/AMP-(fatty) acid ligase
VPAPFWGQSERFHHLHLDAQGHFLTHDGVRQDSEGFFWFMKRLDDVMKVDGSSVSTSEVERSFNRIRKCGKRLSSGWKTRKKAIASWLFVAPRDARELENASGFENVCGLSLKNTPVDSRSR